MYQFDAAKVVRPPLTSACLNTPHLFFSTVIGDSTRTATSQTTAVLQHITVPFAWKPHGDLFIIPVQLLKLSWSLMPDPTTNACALLD